MATAATSRENRPSHRVPGEEHDPPRSARRRRWPWIVAALAVLATVVWLLPGLVAHTPLGNWLLARATADLRGSVAVGRLSLGWLSPVAAEGVAVRDAQGEPVLDAAELRTGKTLLGLLLDLGQLGELRIKDLTLRVVLRDDGSNVEDLLAEYLQSDDAPAEIGLRLLVAGGEVVVIDAPTGGTWRFERIDLDVTLPKDPASPLRAKLSTAIAGVVPPGRLDAELSLRAGRGEPASAGSGDATLRAESVPLALLRPVLARLAPGVVLDGILTGEVQAEWSGEPAGLRAAAQGDFTAAQLVFGAPALGDDRIALDRLRAAGRLAGRDGRIHVEPSTIECELGRIAAEGSLAIDALDADLPAWLLRQPWKVEGRLDLARLAAALPKTLRIRPETRITGGQIGVTVASRPADGAPDAAEATQWTAHLATSDLTAVDSGRTITWPQPVRIALDARRQPSGVVLDELRCDADFLKLHATGAAEHLTGSAAFDLAKLVERAGQFVDLSGIQLAGEGWANADWKRAASGEFQTEVQFQVRDVRLALGDRPPLDEPSVVGLLAAMGSLRDAAALRLEAASVQLGIGADRLAVQLARPVASVTRETAWPVTLQFEGALDAWPGRLAPVVDLRGWQMAGRTRLDAEAVASLDQIDVERMTLQATGLLVRGSSLVIDEPELQASAAGGWSRAKRQATFRNLTVACPTASLKADHLAVTFPEDGPAALVSTVGYEADLARLLRWFGDEKPAVAGRLRGNARLETIEEGMAVETQAECTGLVVSGESGPLLQEPRVALGGEATYRHATGIVEIARAEITSATLSARAAGEAATAAEPVELRLAGTADYDFERIVPLLRPYVGQRVQVAGRGTAPLSYRGPLDLAKAEAAGEVAWRWANVYGFSIGPGEMKARLSGGNLTAEPMDLDLSGGRLYLAPTVRLAAEPRELTLPPGPLARQVQITPTMCAGAMMYVAPILAGVTSAQGTFSIELTECRVPIDAPERGSVAGRLIIHSVEVGPGPLIREMAILMGREAPATLRRESVVPFALADGRVYHQGMELIFPELTIRTHGSVGLDQSLALVAEMPVPPKWTANLGNTPAAAALRNQTITLPVGGTLSQPRLDRRAMEQLAQRLAENAVRNVVEEEVGRALQRLFAPPR